MNQERLDEIENILGFSGPQLRKIGTEIVAEIGRLEDRIEVCETALQRVWDEWSDSPNASDPEAEGYETLQIVRRALTAEGNR